MLCELLPALLLDAGGLTLVVYAPTKQIASRRAKDILVILVRKLGLAMSHFLIGWRGHKVVLVLRGWAVIWRHEGEGGDEPLTSGTFPNIKKMDFLPFQNILV